MVEPRRHPMATTMNMLVDLLDLERIEENIFRGRSPDEDLQRVFGGQGGGRATERARRARAPAPPPRPAVAPAPPLLHPPRRSRYADHLHRRPDPRWPLVHPPPGGRGPAWPGDLRPVAVGPCARAGAVG